MASSVDICNLALSRLGDEANISSISPPDDSVQANYCSTFYPLALNEALDAHNWRFATRRFALPQRTNDADDWAYCYGLPSDFINLIKLIVSGMANTMTEYDNLIEYEIGIASDNQQVLYSNTEGMVLLYVSSTVNTSQFPPSFVQYLSALLAHHLAGPLLKSDVGVNAANKMQELANALKKRAIERDALNKHEVLQHIPAATAARY